MDAIPSVVLALLLLCSGCGMVESKKPLSPPETAVPDKRLEGLWRDASEKPSGYVYIAYGDHGVGSLVSLDATSNSLNGNNGKSEINPVETAQYRFIVTRTGQDEYLNLSDQVLNVKGGEGFFPPARHGTYLFVQVHFLGSREAAFRMVGGEAFANAVKAGKLKGKVYSDDKQNHVADVVLDDSAENILAFIRSSKPESVTVSSGTMRNIGGL